VSPAGVPGLACPQCGRRLVVTMETLLALQPVACDCGLTLRVDAESSKQTLDDLRELERRLAPLQKGRHGPWAG
jgi:hypothetical protein